MLEEPDGLLLDELTDHVTEDSANRVEALVSLADVREANVVKENLLYDEDGDGFAELGTGLHDAQAKRDNLGRQEEVDHFRGVVLDKGANDTKRGQAEILKRSRLGGCVEERIEKQRNMC